MLARHAHAMLQNFTNIKNIYAHQGLTQIVFDRVAASTRWFCSRVPRGCLCSMRVKELAQKTCLAKYF
jgi:hypothetical protein